MSKRLSAKVLQTGDAPVARLLEFDPTPAGLLGDRSLRRMFKNEWARIRTRHFKENCPTCALCQIEESAQKLIEGHEVYSFPSSQVVRLERILFVCKICHHAIHLERTRCRCGPAYIHAVEAHYCKVNGISEEELIADYRRTLQYSCEIRECYGGAAAAPEIDFGLYQSGVDATLKRKRSIDDDDDGFEMYPDHECPWDIGHV